MITNNPYIYHPHPQLKVAADDICLYIEQHPQWAELFEQGKMLGVMLVDQRSLRKGGEYVHSWNQYGLLVAYSGVINGLKDPEHYFVPAVYDLANPDDFYLQEDEEITAINKEIEKCKEEKRSKELKAKRKELSQNLQLKIFSHFNFASPTGDYKNILSIFSEAKRGLPPGGSGECAAPRLWQYAVERHLTPIAMAEFWYGKSPNKIKRVHNQFYPSCVEKCSPILAYFSNSLIRDKQNLEPQPVFSNSIIRGQGCPSSGTPVVIFEDEHLVVVEKPAGLLSSPAKDLSQPNVEDWLKQRYPDCQLPNMLAHRLDQATSGILVAARDAQTHKWLQQGFEQRQFHKSYLAWLDGDLPSDCGIINLPICPNPDDRPRQTVDWQFGKQTITRYRVIKRTDSFPKGGLGRVSLVEFMPLTGRTHQLRLHAASPFGLDHPIVGDTLYNITDTSAQETAKADRLMLHAQSITLTPLLQWQRKPSW